MFHLGAKCCGKLQEAIFWGKDGGVENRKKLQALVYLKVEETNKYNFEEEWSRNKLYGYDLICSIKPVS